MYYILFYIISIIVTHLIFNFKMFFIKKQIFIFGNFLMIITGGRLPPTVTAFTFFILYLTTKYTKITKREKHPPLRGHPLYERGLGACNFNPVGYAPPCVPSHTNCGACRGGNLPPVVIADCYQKSKCGDRGGIYSVVSIGWSPFKSLTF